MVDYLKKSPVLKKLVADRKIDVIGAYYHLGSGLVEVLQ
jgi:carbonic anhydrase